jgi:hypothetical protein
MITEKIIEDFDHTMAVRVGQFCSQWLDPVIEKICDTYGLEYDEGMGCWTLMTLGDNKWNELLKTFCSGDIIYTDTAWSNCHEWTDEELKYEVTEGWEMEWTDEVAEFFVWYKAMIADIRSIEDYLNYSIPFGSHHTYGMYCTPYKPERSNV